jgi:cation diffusion facilitator CzcD-associated flavoprotein CzcO
VIAIVGGGLAGFTAYATLLHGGVDRDAITVFDDGDPDPAAAWRRRAGAIRQVRMRSESDGHCLPTSFPGLAVREARRRRSPVPLLRSVCDRYNPSVPDFLDSVRELREQTGWDERVVPRRIRAVTPVDGGFALDERGTFAHVLLALGHPGLNVPEELARDRRAVHAYEPHEYAAEVEVVGAGMAAATEWLNALAAGSTVVSVRRRDPERRPLQAERQLFSRRGLSAFHAADAGARATVLQRLATPSYPPGRAWDAPVERARAAGRFRVAAEPDGAEQVICATGFMRGFAHDRLLARLVEEHDLETHGRWLVLAPDSTVPALTGGARTLAVAGVHGAWAFPAADTLAGARYAAHAFLRRVRACRTR